MERALTCENSWLSYKLRAVTWNCVLLRVRLCVIVCYKTVYCVLLYVIVCYETVRETICRRQDPSGEITLE